MTQPRPGSDEISLACEEGWVGTCGYRKADGTWQRRALAFQCTVTAPDGSKHAEVFLVDLPDDPTREGEHPLGGTPTTRPAPPAGTVQRRLTFTADRRYPGIQGPRHWLRSSPDGEAIAFLMRDDAGVVQIFLVSPRGGPVRQLTHNAWDITSTFTLSPDGAWIACIMDNSVWLVRTTTGQAIRLTARSPDAEAPHRSACVFSPDGRKIAYLRPVNGVRQIFTVSLPPRSSCPSEREDAPPPCKMVCLAASPGNDWERMSTQPINLFDLTREALRQHTVRWGFSPVHAGRLWTYVYSERIEDWSLMSGLPARFRDRAAAELAFVRPSVAVETHSSDGFTRKYLLALADGRQIETVLMRYTGRVTACISSQVGCAMGCVFCATGQMGYTRHLTPGEIVAQALHVDRVLRADAGTPGGPANPDQPGRLRNIVLMGMGEPLHNYDAVMTAVDILRDSGGLALSAKRITVSTVGVVPGILRLAEEARPINLAVSLHAATQAERAALVPAARKWPLDVLMDACRTYIARQQRRIFYEWTLIEGKNDTPDSAHAVGQLLQGQLAQVNLIPLNPTSGYAGQPTGQEAAYRFQRILKEYGLPSTIRQRRGIDIAAGCGQLAAAN